MIARFARVIAAAITAGLLVGGIIGGVGGRLAMRVLAATSDPALKGVLTDDDEPVGRITAGGTISLVIFLSLGGVLIALVYLVIRRWLPASRPARAAAYGVLFFGVQGRSMFEPGSFDFGILGPRWLAVAMFAAILLGVGAATVFAVDWGIDHWPEPSGPRWYAYLPLLALLPFPPILVLIAMGGLVAWLIETRPAVRRAWESETLTLVGASVVALIAILLVVPTLGNVVDIVT